MIVLENVSKAVGKGNKKREILAPTSASIPSNKRIALLGTSQPDKRIFLELVAGVVMPTAGHIIRHAQVSYPVGYLGGITKDLSLRLNAAHVARLYGADVPAVVDFVEQVMDLGAGFDKPFNDLSRDARTEFGTILAFSIPFDTYILTDGIAFPGTAKFNKKIFSLFEVRARTSGILIPTTDRAFAREFCDIALVLGNGRLRLFEDVKRAISVAERKDP